MDFCDQLEQPSLERRDIRTLTPMNFDDLNRLKQTVAKWTLQRFPSAELLVGSGSLEESDEEQAARSLANFAVRPLIRWPVTEIWFEEGLLVGSSDLVEGMSLEAAPWPWPGDLQ